MHKLLRALNRRTAGQHQRSSAALLPHLVRLGHDHTVVGFSRAALVLLLPLRDAPCERHHHLCLTGGCAECAGAARVSTRRLCSVTLCKAPGSTL